MNWKLPFEALNVGGFKTSVTMNYTVAPLVIAYNYLSLDRATVILTVIKSLVTLQLSF